ncbi:MAG: hypothetical protein QXH92_04560 [Candidatus Aenigmatarchaeota archaeon]
MPGRRRFKIFRESLKRQGDGTLQAYQEYLQGRRTIERKGTEFGDKIPILIKPFCLKVDANDYIKTFIYKRNHDLHNGFINVDNWKTEFGYYARPSSSGTSGQGSNTTTIRELVDEDYEPAKVTIRKGSTTKTSKISGVTGKTYKTYGDQVAWSVPFGKHSSREYFSEQVQWISSKILEVASKAQNTVVNYSFEPDFIRVSKTE